MIREIVQNSLDAAAAAGRKRAEVEFAVEDISLQDIPGIEEYRYAFDKVVEHQTNEGSLEGQPKEIIDSIKKQIKRKKIPVMFISDNGVGLNKKLMHSMLADGQTEKSNLQSLGSHGNGHFSTFALSELRYVLYAGISKEDGCLASGHAILSLHEGKGGERMGKDGYFVEDILPTGLNPYVFPGKRESLPPILMNKLDEIKDRWETGTVLGIVGFNSFNKAKDADYIAKLILAVTALNFFVAIHRDELRVHVKVGGVERCVSSSNLSELLKEGEEVSGAAVTKFPNYASARNFLKVFLEGKTTNITVDEGSLTLHYLQSGVQNTNIALCRSGMWITKDVSFVRKGDFSGRVPFSALILADPGTNGDLPKLVRLAEGNLHNSLDHSLIKDKERHDQLTRVLKKTRDTLRELIDEYNEDFVDFVDLDVIGLTPEIPSRPESGGKIKPIEPPTPIPGPGPGPVPPSPPSPVPPSPPSPAPPSPPGPVPPGPIPPKPPLPKPKLGKDFPVRCIAVQEARGQMRIRLVPRHAADEVEMRLQLNGGADITCDSSREGSADIRLTKVICDGAECPVDGDGTARIGAVSQDGNKIIEAWYDASDLSGDFRIDCHFVRRAPRQ